MQRKRNGDGHTYPYRSGFRTVIKRRGITFSATGKTAAESRRKAKEKLKRGEKLNWGIASSNANTTLSDFMNWWLEHHHKQQIADTTYRRYQQLAQLHILPHLGQEKLIRLNHQHVNSLISHMEKEGQSKRSAQQARALLSACLSAAIEEELIGANPVGASRKIRLPQVEIEPLTAEEAQKVIETATTNTMKLRLVIALYFGLRQGEALGLRWKKINFETGEMTVSHQIQTQDGHRKLVGLKTKSSHRTLPLDPGTLDMLRRQKTEVAEQKLRAGKAWEDNDLVFPNSLGKPLASRWDYEQWHRALGDAGLPKRRLHDARHTCATLLLEEGLDIELIRYWLGHASIELTSRTYIHLTSRTALKGAEAVTRLRSKRPPRAA